MSTIGDSMISIYCHRQNTLATVGASKHFKQSIYGIFPLKFVRETMGSPHFWSLRGEAVRR